MRHYDNIGMPQPADQYNPNSLTSIFKSWICSDLDTTEPPTQHFRDFAKIIFKINKLFFKIEIGNDVVAPKLEQVVPPPTGFGTEEDQTPSNLTKSRFLLILAEWLSRIHQA